MKAFTLIDQVEAASRRLRVGKRRDAASTGFTLIELPAVRQRGFTLIELLVVVTIIVVLLALLTPAMDKAIYQAELAVCGANLDAAATGLMAYAMNNRRRYPYRAATDSQQTGNYPPQAITLPFGLHNKDNVAGYDDRPALRTVLSVNGLQCPPAGKADLDGSKDGTTVFTSYALWAGWVYTYPPGRNRGMYKLGQGLEYEGKRYHVLAGDNWNYYGQDTMHSSHPDSKDVLPNVRVQDKQYLGQTFTWADWTGTDIAAMGTVDLNFAFEDGSVQRFNRVSTRIGNHELEPQFDRMPAFHRSGLDRSDADPPASAWQAIPNTR